MINLPPDRQEEMAGLLQKTSLTGIIEAAKEVTNRLEFIKALQVLVFDPASKRHQGCWAMVRLTFLEGWAFR